MALTIGELVGYLQLDDKHWKRGNKQARDDLRQFRDDIDDFSNRAAAGFLRAANNLSNIPTAAAGIHGVVSILGSVVGVLGLIPAAAAAAAAGIAAIKIGTAGFGKAVSSLLSPSGGGGGGGSGAADRAVQTARRIEGAEASLARAQQTARDAQEALNRARKEAVEQLEDLKLALSGAALDEEAAQLALARAQERLAEIRKEVAEGKEGVSALDLREAELGVRQAAQALAETRERYGDLKAEAAQAAKAGVEGSDLVVAAQRRVADTAQGVRDAQQQLAEAHEDAARSAAKAAGAVSAADQALAKLSPNARATALAIRDMRGQWMDMQHAVQDALFAGLAGEVKKLGGTYLPVLKTGLSGIATEFNTAARNASGFLTQGAQVKTIAGVMASTKQVTHQLVADSMKPLLSILLDIVAVGSEMLPGLTSGFGGAAQRAADFVKEARESGRLREWIQGGLDTLKDIGRLFKQIGQIAATIFTGLDSGGSNLLQTLIKVTAKIRDFLQSAKGQEALHALGRALNAVSAVVTEVMVTAFEELAPLIVELAPGFAGLARQVGGILVDALKLAGPMLVDLARSISKNIDWLGPLAIALYAGVQAFQAVTAAVRIFNAVTALNPWVVIIAATIALVILIVTHWDQIKSAVAAAWDWIKNTARTVWEHIKSAIIDPIVAAAKKVGEVIGGIVGFFRDLPGRIVDALVGLADKIAQPFRDAYGFIRDIAGDILETVGRITGSLQGEITGGKKVADLIPRRAFGGDVMANHPYWVGERGRPELFVPNQSGTIIPDDKLWGNGQQQPVGLHIEHFYPPANATPADISEELLWHTKTRG